MKVLSVVIAGLGKISENQPRTTTRDPTRDPTRDRLQEAQTLARRPAEAFLEYDHHRAPKRPSEPVLRLRPKRLRARIVSLPVSLPDLNELTSELLLEQRFRIGGLAHVQAVLAAFLPPIEVPVRTPLGSTLGVRAVLELEDPAAVVPALDHRALLNKLLASALEGLANPLKLRSAEVGDGSESARGPTGPSRKAGDSRRIGVGTCESPLRSAGGFS